MKKYQETQVLQDSARGERFILELRAVPDPNLWRGIAPAIRLRRLLKFALRVCGFECVRVSEGE